MEPPSIGIDASDERLPESYDDLSQRLEGLGTVYVPHVVIRPEARMAELIRPPRLVVGLSSAAAVEPLDGWAADYVGADPTVELRFQREGRTVALRGGDGETRGRLSALVSEEQRGEATP